MKYVPVSFRWLSLLLRPSSPTCGDCSLVGVTTCVNGIIGAHPCCSFITLLRARAPTIPEAQCRLTDRPCWPFGCGLSLGFFSRFEGYFLEMSRGPSNGGAISSFGYHPSAFPVLHLQWFRLICRSGLVDRLFSDQHRVSYLYGRGFDIPLVVFTAFHLHFLLKISLVQLFKVMCIGSNPNRKPGTELAARVHQVFWSNLGGAMRRCPIGAEESVYFLLEI